MYKQHPVVMFPTNEKASVLFLSHLTNKLGFEIKERTRSNRLQNQHLYILSDEEIKEGDWCINPITKLPFQVKVIERNRLVYPENSKKIIATTDKLEISNNFEYTQLLPSDDFKFYLPQIPQSFIEYFVTEYNKGNIITEVMVEYEEIVGDEPFRTHLGFKLKINPDNTINIKI